MSVLGTRDVPPLSLDVRSGGGEISVLHPVSEPWRAGYRRRVIISDLLAVAAAIIFCEMVGVSRTATTSQLVFVGIVPIAWYAFALWLRTYESRMLGFGDDEFRRVARVGVYLVSTYAIGAALLDGHWAARGLLGAAVLTTVLALCGRCILRANLRSARRAGRCMQRVLVVGHEGHLSQVTRHADVISQGGLTVVAACLPTFGQPDTLTQEHITVAGDFSDIAASARRVRADIVAVIPCPELDASTMRRLKWDLAAENIDLGLLATVTPVGGRTHIQPAPGLPLLHVEEPELSGARHMVKAAIDRVLAAVALLLLWPFLLVLGLAVRATSPGPALFRQKRIGRDGRPFTMLKLRTMVVGAENDQADIAHLNHHEGVLFKVRDDPRTTRVGRWLRRSSLDELPQLINVLAGHMSLVGPRPPLPAEVEKYLDIESLRLRVRPGLTGLWQISGRSDLSWERSVQLDLSYVENWSLMGDFLIMARTLTTVIRGTGAY